MYTINHDFKKQYCLQKREKLGLADLSWNDITCSIPNWLVFDEARYYDAAAFLFPSEEKSSHSLASENFLSPHSKPQLMLYYFVLKIL